MDRRRFLSLSALGTAALHPVARLMGQPSSRPVHLTLGRPTGRRIAEDFTGLSYESAQLSDPEFFKGDNFALIELVRGLGRDGVLRIGGNTSEYCFWKQDPKGKGASAAPRPAALGPDTGAKTPPRRVITEQAVRNLRDFVDATGWSLIYGLNLGQGMPEMAADEAAYVADVMGDRLIAFQMANEPNLFSWNGLRPSSYSAAQCVEEWRRYFQAIRARVPNAPFAGPDIVFDNDWLAPFASALRPDIKFISAHYYAEGPPPDPAMTIARLLRPDPKLDRELAALQQVSEETGLPFRLAESNSCYGGGKQGVSDTFASALWGADHMLRIAQAGGTGVNFHGGGYGWYTPIAGTRAKGFIARPLYYGMAMVANMLGMQLMETQLDSTPEGLRVYGAIGGWRERARGAWIAALNLHAANTVTLRFTPPARVAHVAVMRLQAGGLAETKGITLGGAELPGGRNAMREEPLVPAPDGAISLEIPAGSGAMLHCTSDLA